MKNKVANTFKVLTLSSVLALSAGCASQQLTKDVAEAKALAEAANQAAESARSSADLALQKAEQAQNTADQAMQSASEANACCQRTNEKIDRMFKKSMEK